MSNVTRSFFDKQLPASAVKTAIVVRFFKGWAAILQRYSQRLIYIDLFAGPGSYEDEDGSSQPVESTPIRILRAAIENPEFARRLVSLFNDGNPAYARELDKTIRALPGYDSLLTKPQVFSGPVDDRIAKVFAATRLAPSFLFLDPFGYKGLTRELISSVLKDWGCDAVFFFNYARLVGAFHADEFKKHVDALFGERRAETMRTELGAMNTEDKEEYILEQLRVAMHEIHGKFVLSFRFCSSKGGPKRHIIFLSKAYRGYAVMKEAMAHESECSVEDVPYMEFVIPAASDGLLLPLFDVGSYHEWRSNTRFKLSTLKGSLLRAYAGQTQIFDKLFEEHETKNVGLPFTKSNYKTALVQLSAAGSVAIRKDDGSPVRQGKCPDKALVEFRSLVPP